MIIFCRSPKLKAGGFNKDFIGCEASGRRSLFLKTRGYFLVGNKPSSENDLLKKPPCAIKRIVLQPGELHDWTIRSFYRLNKMAAMGAKVYKDSSPDPIKDFLEILKKGYSDKKYFVKLNMIRAEQRLNPYAVPEERLMNNVKTDMTFDMKHIPVNPITEKFEWNGKYYPFTSFETEPLDTYMDFHILRALRRRDHTRDIPKALLDPEFVFTDPEHFSSPAADDAKAYFEGYETAIKDMEQKLKEAQPEKPEQIQTAQPDQTEQTEQTSTAQPQQPPTKPKKTKSMLINGVEKPQVVNIDIKSVVSDFIEQGLYDKSIPTYMEEPDYKRLLTQYDEFRNGVGSFNKLKVSEADYDDIINEVNSFGDSDDFGGGE
jgi:hypothetical protein